MANRYWVGGTGNWTTTTTNWSATSGGAGGASVPTAADSVFFDSNSNVGTGAFTVTITTTASCLDLTVSGLDGAMTLAGGAAISIAGSLSFPLTNFTYSATGVITFTATAAKNITTNGNILNSNIIFNGTGSWTLVDALTSLKTVTLTAGTLTLGSNTLTAFVFNSNNSNTRAIAFGTAGQITVTGDSTTVVDMSVLTGFSYSGTSKFNFSATATTGTRQIYVAPQTETTSFSINITGGSDTFYFNTPGTNICTYKDINFTGFSGTIDLSTNALTLYGSLTIPATISGTTGTIYILTFAATSGTQILNTNNATITWPVRLTGGATLKLTSSSQQSSTFTLTSGTLDLNGNTLTALSFITATGTKSITFNSGTIVCTASTTSAFNNAAPTNFTTSAGTGVGTISMTGTTAKTFVGGGSTFAAKLNQGGAGALTITGANTFDDITNTVQPASVLFTAATTTTVNNFSLSGTSGNLITIGSVTTASHTLSKASGTVTVSYCTISRSTATGGATWRAPTNLGNVNGANNTGWSFATIVLTVAAGVRNFFAFF